MAMHRFLPLLLLVACRGPGPAAAGPPAPDPSTVGVLVMAHGGDADWNLAVQEAVAPLSGVVPTVVAYGMADPMTLSAGLDSLRLMGVGRVAVVRLFLSGSSFRDQTYYLLGLADTPPERFILMGDTPGLPLPRAIDHGMQIATHEDGLVVSEHAARIILDRAASISDSPALESILILAHGMGDDHENQLVLDAMAATARLVEKSGFRSVRVATLREDWKDKRRVSEAAVRSFVSSESEQGRRTLVLPMRLAGFGPYADVLDGLEYTPGEALLPHPEVGNWIRATVTTVVCDAGWGGVVGPCDQGSGDGDGNR